MSTAEEKKKEKLKRREEFLHDAAKMFKSERKSVMLRFVGDTNFYHTKPQSFGGPDNGIKIPATKETEAFFAKEMAKAQHNKMVLDRHGLKPEDVLLSRRSMVRSR